MTAARSPRIMPFLVAILVVPIGALLVSAYRRQPGEAVITVRPDQQFQTIHGWEAGAQASLYELDPYAHRQEILDELFDKAVEMGLTRLRLAAPSGMENRRDFALERREGRISREEERCARYSTENDNDDPNALDARNFVWTTFDREVREAVLPLARRLEARGERLWLHVQYLAFTNLICRGYQYLHDRPAEYAEFTLAIYQRLRDVHGIVPDSWSVMNEPDLTPHWPPESMAAATAAAGQRLEAAGFTPAFVSPETTDASRAVDYLEPTWRRPELRPFLKELSYHRYSGAGREQIEAIGNVWRDRGLATAMLEKVGAGAAELHADLTLGNVSAWEQAALSYPDTDTGAHYFSLDPGAPPGERAQLSSTGRYLRQYFRALRPGARRIGAESTDEAFKAMAALNPGDRLAVVVLADRAGHLTIAGLTPGDYTTSCWTDRARWDREPDPCAGQVAVDDSGRAVLIMPDAGVFSLRRELAPEP
jgi:hypothetical protein